MQDVEDGDSETEEVEMTAQERAAYAVKAAKEVAAARDAKEKEEAAARAVQNKLNAFIKGVKEKTKTIAPVVAFFADKGVFSRTKKTITKKGLELKMKSSILIR